jgi:hypothetical protein
MAWDSDAMIKCCYFRRVALRYKQYVRACVRPPAPPLAHACLHSLALPHALARSFRFRVFCWPLLLRIGWVLYCIAFRVSNTSFTT